MKRFTICMVLMLSLCGCGVLRQTAYIAVEPHDEDYGFSVDSDTVTVNSYLSLKNAILNFVEDGIKDGSIRAESYRGNLADDLEQAVNEVSQLTPLGAFAVDHMTYDYSKIVSYYEIHINTVFRRSLDEIRVITYVNDLDGVREQLQNAMEHYSSSLFLQIGDYEPFDLEDEVQKIYQEHPEFAFEKPDVTMEMYPEMGTQRILEIRFSYRYDARQLQECQKQVGQALDQISVIYGSSHSEFTNARRFYSRLGRDSMLSPDDGGATPLTNSVYGLLMEDYATSYGFAQTYALLLRSCEMECSLITGQKNGEVHSWCLIRVDGEYYYVDPSMAAGAAGTAFFLMGTQELEDNGYSFGSASDLPVVELPAYLKPIQSME